MYGFEQVLNRLFSSHNNNQDFKSYGTFRSIEAKSFWKDHAYVNSAFENMFLLLLLDVLKAFIEPSLFFHEKSALNGSSTEIENSFSKRSYFLAWKRV